MNICPPGFMCFDYNTSMLIVLLMIIITVFYISQNNTKFNKINNVLDNNRYSLENKIKNLENENHTIHDKLKIQNQIADEALFIANKDMNRVVNPLIPPERSYPYKINKVGVPVNVPTRGYPTGYQQVGVLVESGGDSKLLPLYGQQTWPGSRQWNYYTTSDGFQSVKLPVNNGKQTCDGRGCGEIYSDNMVSVKGYSGKSFKADIYSLDSPKYIPYL